MFENGLAKVPILLMRGPVLLEQMKTGVQEHEKAAGDISRNDGFFQTASFLSLIILRSTVRSEKM